MKRHLLGLALGALVSFALAGTAEACHAKKACATPCPPPAPVCVPAPVVCEPVPVCEPAPVCPPVVETCAPKKSCFSGIKLPKFHMPKFKGFGCHKAAPVCETAPVVYEAAPVVYAAPQASPQASPQVYAAPQASAQN